jgi:peptidoglycan/LPS O-acetylase OafA/YrhL
LRGFAIGLLVVVGLTVTILSLRPGGIRRQLRMAARRLRIFLVLGGVYLAGSIVIGLFFPKGAVADYGPPALAAVLAVVFVIAAQDPSPTPPGT